MENCLFLVFLTKLDFLLHSFTVILIDVMRCDCAFSTVDVAHFENCTNVSINWERPFFYFKHNLFRCCFILLLFTSKKSASAHNIVKLHEKIGHCCMLHGIIFYIVLLEHKCCARGKKWHIVS